MRTRRRTGRRRPALLVLVAAATAVLIAVLIAGCRGGDDMGTDGTSGGAPGGSGGGNSLRISWLGHSTFLITSPGGVRVLTDPYPGTLGYGNGGFKADLVTVSHEHFDHNSVASVEGDPVVARGLAGGDWATVEKSVGDVVVYAVGGTFHDSSQGTQRGKNSLFVIETAGLRLLHLGDLGAAPTADLVERIGRVDVLFIPVGGLFTIDAAAATRVAELFKPTITIPMHYKTSAISDWQISDERPFIEGKPSVRRPDAVEVTVSPEKLPAAPEIWVLRPGPEGTE